MPTRIIFASGRELIVAEEEDQVVLAVRRDHPNPVALKSPGGVPMHANWDHVIFLEEVPVEPT